MQCCYDRYPDPLFGQYLFSHISSCRMGNGIMYVQKLYVVIQYNIHHGTGQCGFIRGIIKKRISRHPYFVIKYVGMKATEAHGLLVGNEMYIVPLISQCLAQLRCQNATAAKGWVTYNAYIHELTGLVKMDDDAIYRFIIHHCSCS